MILSSRTVYFTGGWNNIHCRMHLVYGDRVLLLDSHPRVNTPPRKLRRRRSTRLQSTCLLIKCEPIDSGVRCHSYCKYCKLLLWGASLHSRSISWQSDSRSLQTTAMCIPLWIHTLNVMFLLRLIRVPGHSWRNVSTNKLMASLLDDLLCKAVHWQPLVG